MRSVRGSPAQAQTLAEAERDHILRALGQTGWQVKGPKGAAAALGLKPATLYSRMQNLGARLRGQAAAQAQQQVEISFSRPYLVPPSRERRPEARARQGTLSPLIQRVGGRWPTVPLHGTDPAYAPCHWCAQNPARRGPRREP